MIHSFKRGVHPKYMKAPGIPISVVTPPPQVIIPMAQHIGAPDKPIVAVGDYVKMGQKIGENPAPVSAPVHASVSGKVVAVEPRPHPLGDMIMSVVIENDYKDTPCEDLPPLTPEQLRDPEAILTRIREAGVVGMGGAMFPTAFKIRGGIGKVDKLIINGAECEPYLNGDHLTMLNYPEQLLKGIELVRIASGVDKAYYGIEVNKKDAIALLNSYHPENYGIEIVPEKVKYPQGAEKMQVKAVTGREVKPGGIPSGVGANVVGQGSQARRHPLGRRRERRIDPYLLRDLPGLLRGQAGHRAYCDRRGQRDEQDLQRPHARRHASRLSGRAVRRLCRHAAQDRPRRADDGHLRDQLRGADHQGHLRRSLLHREGRQDRSQSQLHPLRQVHYGLPDEPHARVHVHVLLQGRL